jgi:NAD(P)H-hydrate epimerase
LIYLTRAQVREVDRLAIERYGIPGIVLMENAAREVARAAVEALGDCIGEILVVCGGGNNGGDGLAVARHLHNCGGDVAILLTTDPQDYRGDALVNWRIVRAMQLDVAHAEPRLILDSPAVLVIDAIFGTGLTRAPREDVAEVIEAINQSRIPTLAVDLPSGLDCDSGEPLGACVRAARTVSFVAEKAGFANPAAREYLGRVTVGDIGAPRELIDEVRAPASSPREGRGLG